MDGHGKGLIFDIQRYAIHDGPGIRTTAFLKGCPIRCKWCANPESQESRPEIIHVESECIRCGKCLETCPVKAIALLQDGHAIDRELCDLCGICVENCPADALKIMGRYVSPGSLFAEMAEDRLFWEKSGGGITISGGEPLLQGGFLLDFLEICRENHVHSTVETSLFSPLRTLAGVMEKTDMVICDIKIMDPEKHRKYTGGSNKTTLENLVFLLKSPKEVLVRMPFIPDINGDPENLEATARFLVRHRPGLSVELLPYHRLGASKYERLGKSYELDEIRPPDDEQMALARKTFEKFGLNMVRT